MAWKRDTTPLEIGGPNGGRAVAPPKKWGDGYRKEGAAQMN